MTVPARRRGACPALSAPMETGDGLLVRLMPQDGTLSPAALAGLAAAARDFGNGILEVTARGSLQVRGLRLETVGPLNAAVNALGIRAREGLAIDISPLAELDAAEIADARPLAEAVRAGVAGMAARLGPKVSVVIDGGGAVSLDALKADVRLKAREDGAWEVAVAGDAGGAVFLGAADGTQAPDLVIALLKKIAALGPTARMADVISGEGTAPLSSMPLPPPLRGRVGVGGMAPPGAADAGTSGEIPPTLPSPSRGEGETAPGRAAAHRPLAARTKAQARALRANMTDAEQKLWRHLRMQGLAGASFRRQAPIGPFIADFACHAARLIVELDGGQHAMARTKDHRRDRWLAEHGYRVLRYWNSDVLSNIDGVLEDLATNLRAQPLPITHLPPPLRGRVGVGGMAPPGAADAGTIGEIPPTLPSPSRGEGFLAYPLSDTTFALPIALPFGVADAEMMAALAHAAAHHKARDLRPAPSRMILAVGLSPDGAAVLARDAERLGFILDPADPRRAVIACPGAPACASGRIAARALAQQIAATLAPLLDGSVTVHISGCAKGCAHPAPATLTIVGRGDGTMDSAAALVRHGTAASPPERLLAERGLLPALARLAQAERKAGESGADLLSRLDLGAVLEPSS